MALLIFFTRAAGAGGVSVGFFEADDLKEGQSPFCVFLFRDFSRGFWPFFELF